MKQTTKSFEELTIQEQKMRIVEDAIIQIKNKNFHPANGYGYLRINFEHQEKNISLKDILGTVDGRCTCCAKGAIFAACVINVNEVKSWDLYNDEQFQKKKLKTWFGPLELDTIETAFEGDVIEDSTSSLSMTCPESYRHYNSEIANRAIEFGLKYNEPEERLLAILDNILENGSFTV